MSNPPDHTPQPGGPPPFGGDPLHPPPAREGMSGTTKVLIGCGIAVLVVLVLTVAIVGGGVWFLDRELGDEAGLRRQLEVTQTLNALEEEVDFEPPANGVIAEGRARRFFSVTDESWAESRAFAEDIQKRSREVDERGRATLEDGRAAIRGLGRVRIVLAEALERHDMPPSEYVWTGLALLRAHERAGQSPEESGVPAANLELASRYSERLNEIARGDEDARMTRGTIFSTAQTFIVSDAAGRRFAGWDSLQTSAP